MRYRNSPASSGQKAGGMLPTGVRLQTHPSGRQSEEREGRGKEVRKRERRREVGRLMKLCKPLRARASSAAPISRRRNVPFPKRKQRQGKNRARMSFTETAGTRSIAYGESATSHAETLASADSRLCQAGIYDYCTVTSSPTRGAN